MVVFAQLLSLLEKNEHALGLVARLASSLWHVGWLLLGISGFISDILFSINLHK